MCVCVCFNIYISIGNLVSGIRIGVCHTLNTGYLLVSIIVNVTLISMFSCSLAKKEADNEY